MTTNQLMTGAAVGLALFALYFITRANVNGRTSAQPAQMQRDTDLALWNTLQSQQATWSDALPAYYMPTLSGKLK